MCQITVIMSKQADCGRTSILHPDSILFFNRLQKGTAYVSDARFHIASFLVVSLALAIAGCAKDKPVEDPASAEAALKAGQQQDLEQKDKGSTGAMEDAVAQADLQAVYFDFDRANVRKSEIAKVRKVADLMQKYTNIEVRLEGHADERGSTDYNFVLGQRRSEAVKDLLTSYGIDAPRLGVQSFGEEFPAAKGQTEEAWALNRRVEFVITKR